MSDQGITIKWTGTAAEPRIIKIWDEELSSDKKLLEELINIEDQEDLDEVFEDHIYNFDYDPFIWDSKGKLIIGDKEKDWEFNDSKKESILNILLDQYKEEKICIIFYDVLKASAYFPTQELDAFDESQLNYKNGIITYKGEELEPEDNTGSSSEKYLVKFGKVVNLS
tara:strand:- start:238 stop:741 length:504 start_codon:yes stop_codon:yes gene_type:complete